MVLSKGEFLAARWREVYGCELWKFNRDLNRERDIAAQLSYPGLVYGHYGKNVSGKKDVNMDEQVIMQIVSHEIKTALTKERALMEARLDEFRVSVTQSSRSPDATQRRFNELAVDFLRKWREWRVTPEQSPSIDLMDAIHIFEDFAVGADFVEKNTEEWFGDDE